MKQDGFTLIEVLVTATITVFIAGFLISNFSRTRVDLNQSVATVQDAVREAQSLALSGALTRGQYRCGYGVHFEVSEYWVYAGPDAQAIDCNTENRNYDSGSDEVVRRGFLASPLQFVLPISDIFFEPPDPTTYIGGVVGSGLSVDIRIRRANAACPSADCRIMRVTGSGRIQAQ